MLGTTTLKRTMENKKKRIPPFPRETLCSLTSGKKQLNPSSKSSWPLRSFLMRLTTSVVSYLCVSFARSRHNKEKQANVVRPGKCRERERGGYLERGTYLPLLKSLMMSKNASYTWLWSPENRSLTVRTYTSASLAVCACCCAAVCAAFISPTRDRKRRRRFD